MSREIDGVDYGPLYPLIGRWAGSHGMDVAPDPDEGSEHSEYSDELVFVPAGPADNADEQDLVAVRYHHVVRKNENGLIFHDQIGHWLYEAATGLIMHSLTIPRGVVLLAGGTVSENESKTVFKVSAHAGAADYGIVQSSFMLQKAKTISFEMELSLQGTQLSYRQVTNLQIYGSDFEHVDASVLQRVTYDDD